MESVPTGVKPFFNRNTLSYLIFLSFYLCYRHISFYLNWGNVHGKKYLMYRKMWYICPRAYIPNSRALRLGWVGWGGGYLEVRIFGWHIFGKTYIRRGVIIAFQENGILNTSIVFFYKLLHSASLLFSWFRFSLKVHPTLPYPTLPYPTLPLYYMFKKLLRT